MLKRYKKVSQKKRLNISSSLFLKRKNTLYACALLFVKCTTSSNVTESQHLETVSGGAIVLVEPLSAGETSLTNGNYSVADSAMLGYQPPHNTRVSDPYYLIRPHLSPQVPVNLNPHSRLVLTDAEDRTFFDYFARQASVGLVWPADSNLHGVPRADVDPTNFSTFNLSDSMNPTYGFGEGRIHPADSDSLRDPVNVED